jgi:hypothetical protein
MHAEAEQIRSPPLQLRPDALRKYLESFEVPVPAKADGNMLAIACAR